MWWDVLGYVSYPLGEPRLIQVMKRENVHPDGPQNIIVDCSLDLSCFVDDPNHTEMTNIWQNVWRHCRRWSAAHEEVWELYNPCHYKRIMFTNPPPKKRKKTIKTFPHFLFVTNAVPLMAKLLKGNSHSS